MANNIKVSTMYSKMNNNSTGFRVIVSCKVCKDAGKPESEYTTHFVKDREGKVVCPTLLNLKCRYCQKPGHTITHCPTLQTKNKVNEMAKRKSDFNAKKDEYKPNVPQKLQSRFGFELLEQEDEMSEEVSQIQKLDEFPSLVSDVLPIIPPVHAGGNTYAFMAAKTSEEFENEQFEKKIRENSLKNIKISTAPAYPTEKKEPTRASHLNWAMEDSDSDSDEDW